MRKIKYILSLSLVFVLCMASSLSAFALSAPSFDYEPFYVAVPQLPDGYFDGDILASDSGYSLSLDFSNLSSDYSGSSSSSGSAQSQGNVDQTISFPIYNTRTNDSWSWSGGSVYNDEFDSWDVPGGNASNGSGGMPSGTGQNPTGEITGSSVSTPVGGGDIVGYGDDYIYNESGSESGSSDYSGTVSGSISANGNKSENHYRFRSFSLIHNNSYTWVLCDARNVIHADIRQVNDTTYQYYISTSGGYPNFRISFNSSTGSPSGSGSFSNFGSTGFHLTTVGPLRGLWLSDNAPPPSFTDVPSGPFLRDAVFGKDALLFSYLHLLESDLNTIHNDLTSLNSSMQSSISNQTNTLVNTNSPGNFDQTSMGSTDSLLSLESSLKAPDTNSIFSTGNTFTDGMGFWRDRMNELLFPSNSPVTALTVFSLTLGLAVLVIGRRVSGGGSA